MNIYFSIAFTALIQGGISLFAVYLSTIGYSVKETVLPITLMGLGGLMGSFLGGMLTDYFSPKKMGIFLSALWLFMPFSFGSDSYPLICANMLLVGLSLSSLRAIYLVIITKKYTTTEVEEKLSLRRLVLNLGTAAGSGFIGFLLEHKHNFFGYYFLIIGFLTFVSTTFLPSVQQRAHNKSSQEMAASPSTAHYCLTLSAALLTLLCFSLIPNIYSLYIKEEIGLTKTAIGNMFAINGLLITILQIPITKYLASVNGQLKSLFGIILIGSGVGTIQFVESEWHLYLSTALWTLGEIILFVPILKELLRLSPLTNGKTITSYQLTFSFSEILAPLLGGAIILISYQLLWNLVLVLTAISALIMAGLYIKREKESEYHTY